MEKNESPFLRYSKFTYILFPRKKIFFKTFRSIYVHDRLVFEKREWLHKFKLRHGRTGEIDYGESSAVDCETADDWINN